MMNRRVLKILAALLPLAALDARAQFGPPATQLWAQGQVSGEVAEGYDEFGAALATGDWNGDGYDDLAVGVPYEDYDGVVDAGVVNVFYGTAYGLSAAGAQTFRQTREGGADGETEDHFGGVLAAGDFDGDGYGDLVIGAPDEDSAVTNSGSAQVLYGSLLGLSYDGTQHLFQGGGTIDNWIAGTPAANDRFASALAVGDFNHDGYHDLAAGVPGDRDGIPFNSSGSVNVMYGSATGLQFVSDQLLHRGALTGTAGGYTSSFGAALVAADFDGDGRDDLAIGDPSHTQTIGTQTYFGFGAVYVVFGGSAGLQLSRYQRFHQGSAASLGLLENYDAFGSALAAGDLNGDSRADLVVGVSLEDIETITSAGAINVLYGTGGGLTTTGALFLHQAVIGVAEEAELGDAFGSALAVGNVTGGGAADILVGVPYENGWLGAYHLFAGGPGGVTLTGNVLRTWTSTAGNALDFYGDAIALGDFDGNGALDIAVGAPWEDIGTQTATGRVQVTYGWADDVIGFWP